MNLWNTRDLPEPPINTYKAVDHKIDIKQLYDVFQEGMHFFEDNKFMYAEYAVLSRIVYRMKQKFRSAKDFKALEKINKALDHHFEMDISRNLKNFMALIPSRYKQVTYLPTKNLLDYILVRLQGSVKLMERIVETCKIAAYLLDKRMHTGHFWKIAFITFSIISRVYILAKYTAKFVCEFYNKLIPFSNQLENTSGWSPRYKFPTDLKQWMNVDWLEADDEIQIIEMPTEVPEIIQFFDLVDDDDDVQFCDEYFIIKDDDEVDEKNMEKIAKMDIKNLWELRGFDTREDVGEVIEINDSVQMLDENSFSKKTFDEQNDIKSSPEQDSSKLNIFNNIGNHDLDISNNSVQFVDNNGAARDVNDSKLQQEKPKVFTKTEDDIVTITIPDTPLVVKKGKRMKNKIRKLKREENENKLKPDIDSNFIESKEDTVISLTDMSDTSFEEITDEKTRSKQSGSSNVQSSRSGIYTEVKLNENCLSKKPFERKHDIKQNGYQTNILSSPDKYNVTLSDNSILFENSNIVADRGINSSMSRQEHPVKEETTVITSTPLVIKKEKKIKNKNRKLKMERKGKIKLGINSSVIKSEDTDLLLSDKSFMEITDEKLVKKKKQKTKKPKPNRSIMQSSRALINAGVNLDENSFSKKSFKLKNGVNISSGTFKPNLTIHDNSVPFVASSIHADRSIGNSILKQGSPRLFTMTNEGTIAVTIPNTGLVNRKNKSKKKAKNKIKKMFKSDTNFDSNRDSSVIEIDNDTVASSPSTYVSKIIDDEESVMVKKPKPKKLKQKRNTDAQNSSSLINTGYKHSNKHPMKKSVKSNQNENMLKPNTSRIKVTGNVKTKRKADKNNLNETKINNQNRSRRVTKGGYLYQRFLAELNNSSLSQDQKPPDQTTKLPKSPAGERKLKSTGPVLNLDNAEGQQSGTQSTGTPGTGSRKRKRETGGEDLTVKRIKEAISKNDKIRNMLERKLSETKQNLQQLSRELTGKLPPARKSKEINSNKKVKSESKRRILRKKPIKTVTESHSSIPNIDGMQKVFNKSSDYTLQKTKLMNSPNVQNANKGRKKRNRSKAN